MNTSAISSPVNLVPGNSNAAKPADAEECSSSFGEALSREMGAPAKADGPQSPHSKQASQADNASDNAGAPSAATRRSESNAADKAGSTDTAQSNKAQASTRKTDQDDDTAASPAAEDLLAFVASLTQSGVGRAEKAAKPAAEATATPDEALLETQQPVLSPGLAAVASDQPAAGQAAAIHVTTAHAASALLASGLAPRTTDVTPSVATDGVLAGRPRAGTMQYLNDRAQMDAAANDAAPEMRDPDARLTQPGDARIAADQFAAKASADAAASGKAEATHPRFAAADGSFAKSLQDAQPAGSTPGAIGASAPAQLQAAGIHPAQAAPGQFADRLAPRVGTPGWDQALGQKVIWMVGGELQTASLTLNPPDLGPLQVVLTVSENQATANFTAAQVEVRQALEAAMPKLREMLGEAGIQLGQADVSAGTPDNQPNAFAQSERSSEGTPAQDDNAEPQVRSSRIVSGGQGLVDTFA